MATTFEELGLAKSVALRLAGLQITEPTPVQTKALPPLLSGQDVIAVAPTGTGKTLAYLLPSLQGLGHKTESEPRVLVMAPTRELAKQVHAVAQSLLEETGMRCVLVHGAAGMTAQAKELQAGADVVVGTPGRIMDFYLDKTLSLKKVKVLVLDEADRLMDMGFMPQLRRMLEVLPRKRQNVLCSATFGAKVEQLSAEFLEWPTRVEVAREATVPDQIDERWVQVPNLATKFLLMAWQCRQPDFERAFVFARTKQRADAAAAFLMGQGIEAVAIHANKSQNVRSQHLADFADSRVQALCATDLAARGIDVEAVSHVIHLDLPLDAKDYVHRTGRTGRAGRSGQSLAMVDEADQFRLSDFQKILRRPIMPAPLPPLITAQATGYDEAQEQARRIDELRRRADPDFKGGFHEKKNKEAATANRQRRTEAAKQTARKAGGAQSKAKPMPPGKRKGR